MVVMIEEINIIKAKILLEKAGYIVTKIPGGYSRCTGCGQIFLDIHYCNGKSQDKITEGYKLQ